jgi:hypothetical protein
LAGLLLCAGDWKSAHERVDDLSGPDGCYWHALVHRMEPDTWASTPFSRPSSPQPAD